MIWIYIIFALLEAALAYIAWDAISYEVPSGEELWKEYVCNGGYTFCRKKDMKNYRGPYLKTKYDDIFYKIGFDPFLEKHDFKMGKFSGAILIAGLVVFLVPMIREPGEEGLGISIIFMAGGIFLTLLADCAVRKTKSRCQDEQRVFWQLVDNYNKQIPVIPEKILSGDSIYKIRQIVLHDCYENAQKWLTDSEKKIIETEGVVFHHDQDGRTVYCDCQNEEKYRVLKRIIESGFTLTKHDFDYCPILGERNFEDESEPHD